jgi:hypothetical protein
MLMVIGDRSVLSARETGHCIVLTIKKNFCFIWTSINLWSSGLRWAI